MHAPFDPETAVRERYSAAAATREEALCCPVSYDPRLLEVIPAEVLERDYGCGDPSAHLRFGETVLDLGSGGGKICFLAAQVVGPNGRVIGIDMNPEMLALARRSAPEVARRLGFANVEFREGRIQDLAFDPEAAARQARQHPLRTAADVLAFDSFLAAQKRERPLVQDASIDVVVSNCVLNLVRSGDKPALFREIARVLRKGGRAVISDIVADEEIPAALQADPELWSGCVAGAMREDAFLDAFAEAGLYGVRLLKRDDSPWRTVEGIEFRSVTVEAFQGKEGPCRDRLQAVIYKGPFREVTDDDGHTIRRGTRHAVCAKTFEIYRREPYAGQFEFLEPRVPVAPEEAPLFDCSRPTLRSPKETKGGGYTATGGNGSCCGPEGCRP